jgi:protein TonB
MHMLHQAKWFGLSLTLHLAIGTVLIVAAARNVETRPKAIMVVLDNFTPVEIPLRKDSQAQVQSYVRTATQASTNEPVKTAAPERPLQPALQQRTNTTPEPEQNRSQNTPGEPPNVPAASTFRTVPGSTAPVVESPGKATVPHTVPAAHEPSMPEKANQRYLKEHFVYIRDLITKQLIYPPMARKMRWSGKVIVAFIITEDGSVQNIRVVETSGFPILDMSATETVRNVAPFPKPPVRAEILVPINFKMM